MPSARVRAVLLGTLLAIALPCARVLGQEHAGPGVSLSFRGLTSGAPAMIAKPRRFVPVTVVVSNDGPREVEGVLRVYRRQEVPAGAPPSAVPDDPALFYERALKLPRGARRTETLYYYCQDHEPDRLCVAFESPGAETAVTFPKLDLRTDDALVLSITSNDTDEVARFGGGSLPGPKRPYDVVVKRADLGALPDRAEGYAPFDLIVVSDLDLRSLSPSQLQALRAWVLGGGDLLVAFSGKAAEGLGGIGDDLLPVTALPGAATEERDVRPVQALAPSVQELIEHANMLVKRVAPREDARILLGSASDPLVVRGRAGAGRVTYVAFPLAAVAAWRGAGSLLALALRPPTEELELSRSPAAPPLEEALLNLTEALKTLEPPTALLIGPLLILYVALVAPVNYLVLTRLGKRSYSYVTAAALAFVFAGLFYFVGLLYKGSNALVARAAIIDLPRSPGAPARVDALTGFFSTDLGVVDAKPFSGGALAPIAERSSGRAARVVEPEASDPELRAVELATWSLRRFRTVRAARLGAIVADLKYDGAHVVGKVKNETVPPQTLEAPTLFIGGRCIELDDLRPGETVSVDAIPTDHPALRLADRLLDKLNLETYGARFDDGTTGDPFERDSHRRIRAMLERRAAALNPAPDAVPALLVGVMTRDPGGVDLDLRAQVDVGRALCVSEVDVLTGSNELNVGGLLPRIVSGNGYEPRPGAEGAPPRLGTGPKATEGSAVFDWRLPSCAEHPLTLQSLELRWRFAEDPEAQTFSMDFYDWTAKKYIPVVGGELVRHDAAFSISAKRSTQTAEQLSHYFEPATGTVRVQLHTKSDHDVVIEQLSLSASGKYD